MRRPGGACDNAGAGSAKDTAVGAAKHGGEGKSHVHGKPHGRPGGENAGAKDNFPGNLRIGRPLLVHRWKPNQAEACTEEEHHGRGNAVHLGKCDGSMHARNIDMRLCKDIAIYAGDSVKIRAKILAKDMFHEHLPGYPI